jgi:hypothetical protein
METSIQLLLTAGDSSGPGRLKRLLLKAVGPDLFTMPCTGRKIQTDPLGGRLFHGSLWGLREQGVLTISGGEPHDAVFGMVMPGAVSVSLEKPDARHSSVEAVIVETLKTRGRDGSLDVGILALGTFGDLNARRRVVITALAAAVEDGLYAHASEHDAGATEMGDRWDPYSPESDFMTDVKRIRWMTGDCEKIHELLPEAERTREAYEAYRKEEMLLRMAIGSEVGDAWRSSSDAGPSGVGG